MNIEKIDKEKGYTTITLTTEELGILRNALFEASKHGNHLNKEIFRGVYGYVLILHALTQSGIIPAFEFNKAFDLIYDYGNENKALNF